jgi:hypothetical protein
MEISQAAVPRRRHAPAATRTRRELAAVVSLVADRGIAVVLTNLPALEATVARLRPEAEAVGVSLELLPRADGCGVAVRVQPA